MRKISEEEKRRYAERDRLLKGYRAAREAWFKETLANCERPDEMMKILRYIRSMPVEKEQEFIDHIGTVDWIVNSSNDVRMMILRVVGARHEALYGFYDDPLPPGTTMFHEIKRVLNVR